MLNTKNTIKPTSIDEVELYLGLLKLDYPHLIEDKTYKEIAMSLNEIYKINTNEQDVFLLHEPDVPYMEQDLRIHFDAMNLTY